MEKNIMIQAEKTNQNEFAKKILRQLLSPLVWLRQYYEQVTERKLSLQETGWLLNAQLAFVMTVFPVEAPFSTRLLCCLWLLHAVLKCKQFL
ncbi:hypothetical protein JCM15640A_17770 [Hoylesella timonensis 4401737 = DSM 22865 = JCM 15640]|uniref:hypothetical protein n=1 Tax=Hoylesella timonensis TaxID=386414 RepID=UPI000469F4A2|nr:hypothetical protein [Hoylesella timonensis]